MKRALTPANQPIGPKRCPIYLRLPWKGNVSEIWEKRIRRTVEPVQRCCEVKIIFSSKPMLPNACKDRLPTHAMSNVIYLFECRCRARYVGKTTQRLEARIKQHVPANLRKKVNNTDKNVDSAIGRHLLSNVNCLDVFDKSLFRIVHRARTSTILHILEALYIKHLKPDLCKQVEFVKSLHLFPTVNSSTHSRKPQQHFFTHCQLQHALM